MQWYGAGWQTPAMAGAKNQPDLFPDSGVPGTTDEGRTLIQTALASSADLEVTGHELRLSLEPLSSPHRTRAVAALCDELNSRPVRFPGSRLRLRYGIVQRSAKRTNS